MPRVLTTLASSALCLVVSTARAEVPSYVEYDYVVVNDQLEPTVVRLQEIIAAERSRTHRMRVTAEEILASFQR